MNLHPLFQSRSRSGLSLVEVMISMMILAIALSVLFDSMITSKRVNDRATNQAKAYEEIQAQIETLQYMPFEDVKRKFKGIAFDVQGLRIPAGAVTCGTVTKFSNPNPNDTTLAPNPNKFLMSEKVLPLRFRVAWVDENGPAWVETVYVITHRGF